MEKPSRTKPRTDPDLLRPRGRPQGYTKSLFGLLCPSFWWRGSVSGLLSAELFCSAPPPLASATPPTPNARRNGRPTPPEHRGIYVSDCLTLARRTDSVSLPRLRLSESHSRGLLPFGVTIINTLAPLVAYERVNTLP